MTPLLLDVDTGVDDACALLLAARHPEADLRGVSCAGGNAPLEQVVANTLIALHAAGRDDVPVAAGADRPLLAEPVDARHVHGSDGMGELGWPAASQPPDPRPAVAMLAQACLAAAADGAPVTIVGCAPLTNIALLLRARPEAAAGIKRIVFMGGSAGPGNATAAAEFNVFHDPEAAAITLAAATRAGIPVTMYGLDVFELPRVSREQAASLIAVGGRGAAELGGRLMAFEAERMGEPAGRIGDAGAVAVALNPSLAVTEHLPVQVELGGQLSRGATVVDRRGRVDTAADPHGQGAAIDVALEIEADATVAMWVTALMEG